MSSEKREVSPEASPLKGPAPKAVPEDTSDVVFEDGIPLSPMTGDQTVQFISGAPANGDAKVEIGDSSAPPPTFVGLGKEELMKYANDPFWVRLRWLLFILFWVLWIAMLVGAVIIIVFAPRCAPKKTPADTFYQVQAGELIKNGAYEKHAENLKKLGVETIIVSNLLAHDPSDQPEAVTDFLKIQSDVEAGLFESAMAELKKQGMKILLRIVPNHSGTRHEWFNDTTSDMYVRKPSDEVTKSVWVTQDNKHNAWVQDPRDSNQHYLQQFSGNVADLNFRSDAVIGKFKEIISHWKKFGFNGFLISKASFLVEDLEHLLVRNATRNQPENPSVVSSIVGMTSPDAPVLVELDEASNETIEAYVAKGLVPILKSIDSSSTDNILNSLDDLNENPKAVVNVNQIQSSATPEKARLVNLLVSAGGSRTLLGHDANLNDEDSAFLKSLLEFKHKYPRGDDAKLQYTRKGDLIAAHRADGDNHIILANLGESTEIFDPVSLDLTDTKGVIELATPNAGLKAGDTFPGGQVSLPRQSGLVIKLDKKEEEA